ncbi:MAG: hypothetical protein ACOX7H_02075 [Bacillota bacterium]|jgi:hypothetical protein
MQNKLGKFWSAVVLAIILCGILALTFGCENEEKPRLSYMSPQTYEHPSGYQVQVPFNWKLVKKSEAGTIFTADQGALSFNILAEIGGMDYYTPQELGENIFAFLSSNIKESQVIEEIPVDNPASQYRQLILGKDEQGRKVYIDTWITAPLDTVHYYLIFTCGGDDYEKYRGVFDDIIKKFKLVSTPEEIYKYLDSSAREEMVKEYLQEMLAKKEKALDSKDTKIKDTTPKEENLQKERTQQ